MASHSNVSLADLKMALRTAQADGTLEMLLSSLREEPSDEFELLGGESMTDASKRRLTSPPDRMEKESEMSGSAEKLVGDSPASFGDKLPKGVTSMEQWSRTLLKVGKYGKDGFTYQNLYSSPHQAHSSYVSWLITQKHRVDLTAPMKDFVRYLVARSKESGPSGECFEGSSVRREVA